MACTGHGYRRMMKIDYYRLLVKCIPWFHRKKGQLNLIRVLQIEHSFCIFSIKGIKATLNGVDVEARSE